MLVSEQTINKEKDMRGAASSFSVWIESFILRMIYFSNTEQYYPPNSNIISKNSLKLKGLMFNQKIIKLHELLKKYHPDLLQANEFFFENLNTFKDIRNKMAHCLFTWDKSIDEVDIWDLTEDENSFQYLHPTRYNTEKFIKRMINSFNDCEKFIDPLMNELEDRFRNEDHELLTK